MDIRGMNTYLPNSRTRKPTAKETEQLRINNRKIQKLLLILKNIKSFTKWMKNNKDLSQYKRFMI